MKCFACQTELEAGRAKCPVCGFPVIQSVEGNTDELEGIRKMGRDYLKKRLLGIRVGIVAYSYVMDHDELKQDKTQMIDVAEGEALAGGSIVWSPMDFARVDSDEPAQLTVFVASGSGMARTFEQTIQLPKITGFAHIGVMLAEGLDARMAYGNEENYVLSDRFSLV